MSSTVETTEKVMGEAKSDPFVQRRPPLSLLKDRYLSDERGVVVSSSKKGNCPLPLGSRSLQFSV